MSRKRVLEKGRFRKGVWGQGVFLMVFWVAVLGLFAARACINGCYDELAFSPMQVWGSEAAVWARAGAWKTGRF